MNPALAATAAALGLGLAAYYGTGAVRWHLRDREDARYRAALAAERERAGAGLHGIPNGVAA